MRGNIPASFADAVARLGARESRVVANNTRLWRRGDDIALRHWSTDVVTWHADGRVTLNTGGWWTMTTRVRINRALAAGSWQVYNDRSRRALSFCVLYDGGVSYKRYDFVDGVEVRDEGWTTAQPWLYRRRRIAHPSTAPLRETVPLAECGHVCPWPRGGRCCLCAAKASAWRRCDTCARRAEAPPR